MSALGVIENLPFSLTSVLVLCHTPNRSRLGAELSILQPMFVFISSSSADSYAPMSSSDCKIRRGTVSLVSCRWQATQLVLLFLVQLNDMCLWTNLVLCVPTACDWPPSQRKFCTALQFPLFNPLSSPIRHATKSPKLPTNSTQRR